MHKNDHTDVVDFFLEIVHILKCLPLAKELGFKSKYDIALLVTQHALWLGSNQTKFDLITCSS